MGVGFYLVNQSKREVITFCHLPARTSQELAGHPDTAAIVTWYMLTHVGDRVSFVADTSAEWPFSEGCLNDLAGYRDVTDDVIKALIEVGILVDDGREVFWPDEPDVYIRRLRNIWLDAGRA